MWYDPPFHSYFSFMGFDHSSLLLSFQSFFKLDWFFFLWIWYLSFKIWWISIWDVEQNKKKLEDKERKREKKQKSVSESQFFFSFSIYIHVCYFVGRIYARNFFVLLFYFTIFCNYLITLCVCVCVCIILFLDRRIQFVYTQGCALPWHFYVRCTCLTSDSNKKNTFRRRRKRKRKKAESCEKNWNENSIKQTKKTTKKKMIENYFLSSQNDKLFGVRPRRLVLPPIFLF